MKKVLNLSLLFVILFAFGACKKSSNDPAAIAKEYVLAINKMDYEKAKTLSTEETIKFIEMMKAFSNMGGDESKLAEFKKKVEKIEVEILNTDMQNDTMAICKYKVTGIENQEPKEESINLVKRNNKWLVHQKKEGLGNENPEVSDTTKVDTTSVAK